MFILVNAACTALRVSAMGTYRQLQAAEAGRAQCKDPPAAAAAAVVADQGRTRGHAAAIVSAADTVISSVTRLGKGFSMEEKREAFTRWLVVDLMAQHPYHSVLVVHTEHSFTSGSATASLTHQHVELYYQPGITSPSTGFEVYLIPCNAGRIEFQLLGDDGYMNFAYDGFFQRTGNTVIFNPSQALITQPLDSKIGSAAY